MKLTSEQVRKVARLANLSINKDQEERYSEQLSKILDYVEELNKVDTSDIPPTFNVSGKNTVLREDEVRSSLAQEEAIKNGSLVRNGFFVTKGVFEEE